MTAINPDAFSGRHCHGTGRGFKPKTLRHQAYRTTAEVRVRNALISVDPVDLLQPLLHRRLQVIAGLAILRIAAGDELVLLLF